jgi:hypothetical protein
MVCASGFVPLAMKEGMPNWSRDVDILEQK